MAAGSDFRPRRSAAAGVALHSRPRRPASEAALGIDRISLTAGQRRRRAVSAEGINTQCSSSSSSAGLRTISPSTLQLCIRPVPTARHDDRAGRTRTGGGRSSPMDESPRGNRFITMHRTLFHQPILTTPTHPRPTK